MWTIIPLISMRCGEQLNLFKSSVPVINVTNHTPKTFLLTHAHLVGDKLKESPTDLDVLKDFVSWVNNDKTGSTVEAVFVGHTHENHIFYPLTLENADDSPLDQYNCYYHREDNKYKPEDEISLTFLEGTFYIETTTAILDYLGFRGGA